MRSIFQLTLPNILTKHALEYIRAEKPDFVFLYMVETDEKRGHDSGWMTETYLQYIHNAIDNVKAVLEQCSEEYTVIVTADHGGHDRGHGSDMPEDMTIPMFFIGKPFLLILIGFLLAKCKVVSEDSTHVLSRLENSLFIPALVLGNFVDNFTLEKLSVAWKLILISSGICLIMIVLAILAAKWCSKDKYIRNIYTYGLSFSNFAFMGNAVVSTVFPDLFLEYLIFTLPLWIAIYLWGVPCLLTPSEDGKHTISKRLKAFGSPMFIAMVVGRMIGLSGIELPSFLTTVISVSGNCMSPVAMLLTGITIAGMNFKKVFSQRSLYVVSLLRLLLFPFIFLGVFCLVPMSKTIVICTICSLAMPLGLNTIVIPGAYGRDTSVAAGMAVVSHLLSCVTIPLIFYLMMNLL